MGNLELPGGIITQWFKSEFPALAAIGNGGHHAQDILHRLSFATADVRYAEFETVQLTRNRRLTQPADLDLIVAYSNNFVGKGCLMAEQ